METELLGVNAYIKLCAPGDTGISVNAGEYGRTILAIASLHTDVGDNTSSQVDMLRLGYSGNHLSYENIARSGSQHSVTYSVSNNNTIVINGELSRTLLISNKPFV